MYQITLKSLILIIGLIGFPVLETMVPEKISMPEAKGRAHLIYHPASKAFLLFDGYSSGHLDSTQNNVWKWDGKQWNCIKAYGPGSRVLNAGALNTQTGNVQLFGGWGKGIMDDKKGDVWAFNGSVWKQIHTNNIGTHDHHKMVYADHLEAFVIYGGFVASFQPDTTTWLLKENQFTALNLPGPGPRGNAALAYDPVRKKVVLYGGKFPNSGTSADLWEFDGARWEQIPVENTGVVSDHAMTYNRDLKMVVIHNLDGETWGWNGKTMKKLASNGPHEIGVALGYDPVRKVVAAYGGFGPFNSASSSLWELKDRKWQKVSDNGSWLQVSISQYERMSDVEAKAFNKANALLAQKNLSEAETVLLKAMKAGIKSRVLYAQLGQVQYQLGKYAASVQAYEKLVQIKPIGRDFYDLARGYARINETDKAFTALYKAIEKGYGSKEHFQKENDLAFLKADSRFKGLLEKVK